MKIVNNRKMAYLYHRIRHKTCLVGTSNQLCIDDSFLEAPTTKIIAGTFKASFHQNMVKGCPTENHIRFVKQMLKK